jgi:hypothetical protein
LEFGSLLQEPLLCKGPVKGHISMVQDRIFFHISFEWYLKFFKTIMKESDNTLVRHGQTRGAPHPTCQICDQHGILLRFCDRQLYFREPVGVVSSGKSDILLEDHRQ